MNACDICSSDLSGLDVEYHYGRNHGMGAERIPWRVLLSALRETNQKLWELRGQVPTPACVGVAFQDEMIHCEGCKA